MMKGADVVVWQEEDAVIQNDRGWARNTMLRWYNRKWSYTNTGRVGGEMEH
jgi:citrate lyase beta subunit